MSLFLRGKALILIAAVCIVSVGLVVLHKAHSPRQVVQGALGIELPDSAHNIVVTYKWLPDSRIIELWAMMDLSLGDGSNARQ